VKFVRPQRVGISTSDDAACHIIVSLESIECVESHRSPNKNAGANLREYGARQKDRPIAATLKRKLLTKGKDAGRANKLFRRQLTSS
jgi:hypothetical protein